MAVYDVFFGELGNLFIYPNTYLKTINRLLAVTVILNIQFNFEYLLYTMPANQQN
jgi:hypothetical protein